MTPGSGGGRASHFPPGREGGREQGAGRERGEGARADHRSQARDDPGAPLDLEHVAVLDTLGLESERRRPRAGVGHELAQALGVEHLELVKPDAEEGG